ncbi:GNAT family N-acetyltransferase [Noviherbaspirillum aridicola]|uniref:ElaA protein n=1 Tax=Noviherbaspirillum aridicola TaxID=2849687 RepID=A0ABQ4Q496_9BURK|nr:GNAT family N-acetyltransferase [Noviherbaspirillum aridicola]GIZ51974.1 ElaA protein [Noviherbaspirillum aridicola]
MLDWTWLPFHALTPEQLYDAMMLRQRVFVIEQRCLYPDADGLDPACRHGLAYSPSGTLHAYARILQPGVRHPEPSIGRVVVVPELRGRGLGRDLMQAAMREAMRLFPGQPLRISAQAHLRDFYRQFGFEPSGPVYDDAGIPHVDMFSRGPV